MTPVRFGCIWIRLAAMVNVTIINRAIVAMRIWWAVMPPGQLVVEQVVDDVDGGEERHTASRAVPLADGLSDRSTRIISRPR